MANEEWPIGERHAHHRHEAERVQRKIALLYRDHHTRDGHTVDGSYAAHDEAFIRLAALETPTQAVRLALLRKQAAARTIRRKYNKEANWLVKARQHLHYGRLLMLHTLYPDRHEHPGTDGLTLRDEDKARIGPTRKHLRVEAEARINDLRPTTQELLIDAILSFNRPNATTDLRNRQIAIRAIRQRENLLALAPIQDDYFEPEKWWEEHTNELRDLLRIAILGKPETTTDVWHALVKESMSTIATVNTPNKDDYLLSIPKVVDKARKLVDTYPTWANLPTGLPTITVSGGTSSFDVAWAGELSTGISVVVTLVIYREGVHQHEATYEIAGPNSPNSGFSATRGRTAFLVQFAKTINGTEHRTAGSIILQDIY